MKIRHHPSDETLAAFASGTLDEGRSLVVATHLSLCATCRGAVRTFEEVGGALLDGSEPAAMRADALERAGAIDAIERQPSAGAARNPAARRRYSQRRFRKITNGSVALDRQRHAFAPGGCAVERQVRVFMLKAAPGKQIPHHRHTGMEWTCIFQGAFEHDLGRYGPGDFDEADETMEHKPVVEDGVPCVCLVALQGNIEFQGWFGRLLQPFVRI